MNQSLSVSVPTSSASNPVPPELGSTPAPMSDPIPDSPPDWAALLLVEIVDHPFVGAYPFAIRHLKQGSWLILSTCCGSHHCIDREGLPTPRCPSLTIPEPGVEHSMETPSICLKKIAPPVLRKPCPVRGRRRNIRFLSMFRPLLAVCIHKALCSWW